MNRFAFALALLLAAPTLAQPITDSGPPPSAGTFTIGPRLSSYSTDADVGLVTVESGRQTALGLTGEYRNGPFVLDFLYDHDPENGISIADLLPIEFGNYSRDRGEATVGYAVLPNLDLQGGIRFDSVSIGGHVLGGGLFDGADIEHQAIVFGAKVHSTTNRPFGAYGLARGYIGSADSSELNIDRTNETTGFRLEGGFVIAIGETPWRVVPGIEWEHIEAEDNVFTLDTNRLFLNFEYQFR